MHGLILNGSKNVFEVECEDGLVRSCPLKGKTLKAGGDFYNPLAPGDVVEIDGVDDSRGVITGLSERRNMYVRWNIKKRLPQIMAANLDQILIVTTPEQPPFRPRFIDRALAQSEYENITPVIVCNKYDLPNAQDESFQEQLSVWEGIGYKVLRLSARTGEGMMELAEILKDRLSALVGQSGVGKSSIINVLDNNVVLKTGSLSQKYGKGCHTTTKGSLMHIRIDEALTGGVKEVFADIIDTPGVRRFLLHDITAENLAFYFREFKPFLGKCEFGMSCSHIAEEGCAIKQAVQDGKISPLRYESWKRIHEELKTGSFED